MRVPPSAKQIATHPTLTAQIRNANGAKGPRDAASSAGTVNIAEPTVMLMMAAASAHTPSARTRPVSRLFTITCYSPPAVPSIRQEGGVVSKIPAGVGPQYPHVIVLVG